MNPLAIKYGLIALAFIGALSASAWGGYKLRDLSATAEMAQKDRAHAQAVAAAVVEAQTRQRAADQVAIDIAGQQGPVQEKIIVETQTVVERIPYYVSDASGCITIGLIRVLDAAALGADPAALDLAPGERNDTCAGIGPAALAEHVSKNYGRARQDAARLTGAQDYIRGLAEAVNRRTP